MIDSATIVGVIDRLEAMKLLMREGDPDDRRLYRLLLTPQGLKALPAMQTSMNELNAEIDAELSQSAASVRKSLKKLAALQTKKKA